MEADRRRGVKNATGEEVEVVAEEEEKGTCLSFALSEAGATMNAPGVVDANALI